uniref:F-box domain-containing protein n=1 Tax=Ditylenchus dipsaci TaxID=166011 RepID=A0A915CQ41_9BILA
MSHLPAELCRDVFDYLDRPNLDKLNLVCRNLNYLLCNHYQKSPIRPIKMILASDYNLAISSSDQTKEKTIYRSTLGEMLDLLEPKYVRLQKFLLLWDNFMGGQDFKELARCRHAWTDANFSLTIF